MAIEFHVKVKITSVVLPIWLSFLILSESYGPTGPILVILHNGNSKWMHLIDNYLVMNELGIMVKLISIVEFNWITSCK